MTKLLTTILLLTATLHCQAQSSIDKLMQRHGMVNVNTPDSVMPVDLMYRRADNFTGQVLYDGFSKAWLHPQAAKALRQAQKILSSLRPGYKILILDAARPMSAQRKMYKTVQGTPQAPYVSNPRNGGGLHNYGLAVDVTIIDPQGHPLPMGTPVDHLGPEANIDKENLLLEKGIITPQEHQNRLLLRKIMQQASWQPLRSEWWHFNLISRKQAIAKGYTRLDF